MSNPIQRQSTPTKPSQPLSSPSRRTNQPSSPSSHQQHDQRQLSIIQLDLGSRLEKFLKFRQEWDEIILGRSLGLAVKIMELESEIQLTIQHASFLQKCQDEQVELKDGYAWKQLCKSNELKSKLIDTLDQLARILEHIQDLSSHLESFVQSSCRTLGTRTVFETPVGSTWPLPRFCDHLIRLSTHYPTSLSLHERLSEVLCSTDSSTAEKQAALSYWACQPLMYDKEELKELLVAELPEVLNFGPSSTPRKKC